MTKTPSSLLERLRQPFEAAAWEQFVSLYTPLIYSWGRRVGLQEQDAADLVQDVFVTLVQVLPTFTYDRHKASAAGYGRSPSTAGARIANTPTTVW